MNNGSLHLAITADPELPVPPTLYGGIERVVDLLATGLAARGHKVTLFAHPASTSAGHLLPWPGATSQRPTATVRNALHITRAARTGAFDLIHSFSRLAYLTALLPTKTPKLMTYQRPISRRSVEIGSSLSSGTLWFSAISEWMMKDVRDVGTWRLIYNGVPLKRFHFQADVQADAPLMFLGRMEAIKGPHIAIRVAKQTNSKLVLAGNVSPGHEDWFRDQVLRHVDGEQISYMGPVDDAEKNVALGRARALLMPILWDEPFGIVMAEAMACGTPVIGLDRGSVPEVVEHGLTGFVCQDESGLIEAVGRASSLSRYDCRSRVERLFSDDAIVEAYVNVYREMLSSQQGAQSSNEEAVREKPRYGRRA